MSHQNTISLVPINEWSALNGEQHNYHATMLHHINYVDDSLFCLKCQIRALALSSSWKYRHKDKIPTYCQCCNYPAWFTSHIFFFNSWVVLSKTKRGLGGVRKSNFIPKVIVSATSRNNLQDLPHTYPSFPAAFQMEKRNRSDHINFTRSNSLLLTCNHETGTTSFCSQDKKRPWEEGILKAVYCY